MSETLREIGEKKLLQRIQTYLGKSRKIVRTFSEDCAVVDAGNNKYQLLTVDVLVEGTHFRREYMPCYYIGRKGLKVNISDVSAMGGKPLYYLVSIGAPPELPVQMIEEIYQGMASVAEERNIALIGGNLSSSPVLFLDIVMIGEVSKDCVLMRNGAKVGDSIFVTGSLGAAAEGLKLLDYGFRLLGGEHEGLVMPDGCRDPRYVKESIMSQIDPPCMNDLAQRLASWKIVRAMIDLSDGVAPDVTEICRESKVGAVLEIRKLPIAASVLYWERKRNLDPADLALRGGEDYHLLFTVSRRRKKELLERAEKEKVQLFEIGRIVDSSDGICAVYENGEKIKLDYGYEHFLQP